MVDPIGVIGLAGQLLEFTFKFYNNWKDVKADTKSFILEVGALKTTLLHTRTILSDPNFASAFENSSSALLSELDPLHGTDTAVLLSTCENELQHLLAKMKKRADGHRLGWECLKAALDGGKAREAVENLHRRYQTLNLLFGRDQLVLQTKILQQAIEGREDQNRNHQTQVQKLRSIEQRTSEIEVSVNTVASGVNSMVQETHTAEARQKHGELLQWLSSADYSPQQADFLRQREEGTGQWFIESHQFQEWYSPCYLHTCLIPILPQANQSTRLSRKPVTLFCPGIPGAGKTILVSIIIDYLQRNLADCDAGIAYLYCNFRRVDDQSVEQLIANLVKQLLRNKFPPPPAVMDVYARHEKHRSQPSLSDLEEMFHAVAALYKDRAFVVVDALDECQMNDNVRFKFIETLLRLQSRKTNINLLATSRPVPDIVEAFNGHPRLEIVAQRDDIERYMRNRMSNLRAVSKYPDLQHEIISCIASVADGM
jgi:NACHT domain.